jgi:hypothetical protein
MISLISVTIDKIRKPYASAKKKELLFQTELYSARKALEQTTDVLKTDILKSYISCLEFNEKADEIESIIDTLKEITSKKSDAELENQLKKYETDLSDLNDKLQKARFDVDKHLSKQEKKAYSLFCEAFEELMSSEKAWIISFPRMIQGRALTGTAVDRKRIGFYKGIFDFIKSEFETPILTDCNEGTYYIYPRFIIKALSSTSFDIFPIESVEMKYKTERFIEDETVPGDCEITGYSYRYVNSNENSNQNSYNLQLPTVNYGSIIIDKLGITYYVSNAEVSKELVKAYQTLQTTKSAENIPPDSNSDNYIDLVNCSVEKITDFYNYLKDDAVFRSKMSETVKFNFISDGISKTPAEQIRTLFWIDLINCYNKSEYAVDLNKKEGLGLMMFMARSIIPDSVNHINFSAVSDKLKNLMENIINQMNDYIDIMGIDQSKFVVSDILGKYDPELQKKYLALLHKFMSVIANTDNPVSDTEDKWLAELLKLSKDSSN